jgi:dipeptidyl aminopeptidase/acylaminoacyl peptidase
MRLRLQFPACIAALLTLGACADAGDSTAPSPAVRALVSPAPAGDRLATVESDGSIPMLYLQHADGSARVRVHFDHVSNHVTGNYSPRQLPVTDETILAIPRVKWSPDGRYLAVIVAPSTEALQVVLVSADGRALRTVSPNSQYLWGDVEWSPDARRIAYIVATGPFGSRPDLFVTDLGADRVTRVTTGSRLSGYDVVRFDPSGQRLYFTERLGFTEDGVNGLARLASVDLTSGTVTTADTVVGEPQGLPRDGSWALFMRWSAVNPGARELFRRATDGSETVLASGDLRQAVVLEGDREALLHATLPKEAAESYSVIGLDQPDDVRLTLPTQPSTTWAALWRQPVL